MNLRFFAVVALLSILLSLFSCNRGMREIQRLELNGYIIPTPNREIKSAVAKSRSESGGSVGGDLSYSPCYDVGDSFGRTITFRRNCCKCDYCRCGRSLDV